MTSLPPRKRGRYKQWRRKNIGVVLFVVVCVLSNVFGVNGARKSCRRIREEFLVEDGDDSINSNSRGKRSAFGRRIVAAESGVAVAAEADTTPTEAPTSLLTTDMREIMSRVSQVSCEKDVIRRIDRIHSKNWDLFDACNKDSGYQVFPSTGFFPNEEEIARLCNSDNCMNLFTGIRLAILPECDIDNWSMRSASEVMFRIRKDLSQNKPIPNNQEFDDLYNLNRVVNILYDNLTVFDDIFSSSSYPISLEDMTRVMNPIEMNPDVSVRKDLTIVINGEGRGVSSSSEDEDRSREEAAATHGANARGSLDGASGENQTNSSTITAKESESEEKKKSKMHSSILIVGIIWCCIHLVYCVLTRKKGVSYRNSLQ